MTLLDRPVRLAAVAAVLLATLATLACDVQRGEPDAVAAWEVAPTARVAIGDAEGRDTVVFSNASDARWHPTGVLVVADVGASGLRVFDAQGALRVSAGRRGRGPNEFVGGMALAEAHGDSVAVWDSGQARWTMFNVVDGGMRTSPDIEMKPAWMHGGVMVYSAREVPPAWVPPLLARLSQASADMRLAHIDRSGLLFVSTDVGRRNWQVYRDSVAPIATIALPAGLAVTHFADDAVVGFTADSLGLQQVVVHALERTSYPAPDTTPAAQPVVDPETRDHLRSALRNAVMAQEMHWMKAQAYTASADSIEVVVPEGAEFKVLEASQRGWRAVAWYPATGLTCGMIVGLSVPPGWSEGEVNCGWRR